MSRKQNNSSSRSSDGNWGPVRLALIFILLWGGLLAWQVFDHAEEARRHRKSLQKSSDAGLGLLEASIRAVGRGRRQRPEFLEMVFEGVSSVPGILGAWLTEPDGKVIYSKSDGRQLSLPESFSGAFWSDDGLLVGRRVDIGPCPFDGQGRLRPTQAVNLPLYLFLFIDCSEVNQELKADLRLRVVIQAAALVAALGGFLFLRTRGKTRRLSMELAVSEERLRRHKEWAILGAGLAHETKNPLSAVRGIAQRLAEEEKENQDRCERARDIVDEVDRVVARINEFLHYSRPLEPRPEPVDLRSLFEEMSKLIEPDLSPRRGKLTIQAGTARVLADPGMLRQALLNLLVNAARAISMDGRIRLSVQSAVDGTCSVEVEDDGLGIPAEEFDKVFLPYYTRAPGGTGLGLAIVRRLVEAHGWKVEMESQVGSGTTFRILGMQRASP